MASNLLMLDEQEKLLQRFGALCEFAESKYAFYRQRFDAEILSGLAGVDDLCRLPILKREEIDRRSIMFREVWGSHPPCYFESSGTTANPVPVIPNLDPKKMEQFGAFLNSWMGLKNDNVLVALVALPFDMNPMGLKYFLGLKNAGVTVIPAGVRNHLCEPNKVIELIQQLKPDMLLGRPLELLRYAEHMQDLGVNPADTSVRKIFYTGEIVSTAKRNRLIDLYGGVELYSTYGLTEIDTGLTSCSCGNYHIYPDSYNQIIELVDESGRSPVAPGDPGCVIMTNLEETHMPLIRYETGDLASCGSNCVCGMDTPYLTIYGRKVDQMCIKGKTLLPIEIEQLIYEEFLVGSDYQLVVENGGLTINVENRSDNLSNEEVASAIRDKIGVTLNIRANVVAHTKGRFIDKTGIAKYKAGRFICTDGMSSDEKNAVLSGNH